MRISGRCHCGNISFEFSMSPDPEEIPARACTCSFCLKHGGVWTASPSGSLRVRIRQPDLVTKYAFGTKTAEFHVCSSCGVVPIATSRIEARDYAVVSVNAFEGVEPTLLRRSAGSFDGEAAGDRLARRAQTWISDVVFEEGSA